MIFRGQATSLMLPRGFGMGDDQQFSTSWSSNAAKAREADAVRASVRVIS